jgi:hypothetical protein
VFNCRLVLGAAASGAGGSSNGGDTEPVYLDVTTLREPEKQIAETKIRDTEGSNRSLFMPILGKDFTLLVQSSVIVHNQTQHIHIHTAYFRGFAFQKVL